MPEREAKFVVNALPAELWTFLRDFQALCACIPGVERIRPLDDRTAELRVKEKVGVVPLTVDLTARIDSEEPPHRLHATARGEHLKMSIDVTLQRSGAATELLALFRVKGEGQLKPIVDRLFERRATERAAQFAQCLEKRFGAVASEGAQAPPREDRRWAQDFAGWIREWLARCGRSLRGRFTSLRK